MPEAALRLAVRPIRSCLRETTAAMESRFPKRMAAPYWGLLEFLLGAREQFQPVRPRESLAPKERPFGCPATPVLATGCALENRTRPIQSPLKQRKRMVETALCHCAEARIRDKRF